jgi:hypothetical protein
MKTVKQIIDQERKISLESDSGILESLVQLGLLEQGKANLVKRALYTNTSAMTMAEKKSMVSLTESLIAHVLSEKQDHLSAYDTKRAPGYPSEKDIPVVLVLRRKAIRVYPDNQKVAMYYSQALDKYISIPFGPKADELGIHMTEETKEDMGKIRFEKKEKSELKESSPKKSFRSNLKIVRESKQDQLDEWVKALELAAKVGSKAVEAGSKLAPKAAEIGAAVGSKIKDVGSKAVTAGSSAIKTFKDKRAAAQADKARAARKAERQAKRDARIAKREAAKKDSTLAVAPELVKPSSPESSSGIDFSDAVKSLPGHDTTPGARQVNPVSSSMTPDKKTTVVSALDRANQRILWGPNESTNLDIINSIVENNLKEDKVSFGDKSIFINNRTAKKIIQVHESLNKTNKKKFEQMINENAVSFRKAINFVVKAR